MPQDKDMASLKRRYLLDIELYERTYRDWENRGKGIVKRYRDERDALQQSIGNGDARYNILWSNVQTTLPAVFARLPKPEVSRRYKDKDPVGRVASLLLERALEYEVEQYSDYASAVQSSVEDRLLPGRGIAWIRYEPVMKSVAVPGQSDAQITEDTPEPQSAEIIDYECAPVDYVHWKDFGHNVARTWEEVTLVWRRVPLTRSECIKRFGKEIGSQIALDQKADFDEEQLTTPEGETLKKATIYEIWDKKEGTAVWIAKSVPEALDCVDDPLQLDCFFPCPKPLYATTTTDSLIPVADYVQYQDQARELDVICERIDGLVKALKVVGVYDSTQTGVQRMLQEGVNNTLIPVENWMMFAEKGGIKGVVEFLPLDMIINALNGLYLAREQSKAVIYEITGLSDIIRGASDPNETLGAQQLKGQFASKRLKKLQDTVSQFATDLLKLKAQIICKHYQPKTILTISGAAQLNPIDQQFIKAAITLLKTDASSNFRIEVSSDSLIEVDEQQEKQNRLEFLTAVSGFIEKAIQAPPELAPLMGELLLYGIRGFKAGKTLEGVFDETMERLKQKAAQPQQPPPDPAMIKAQNQMQIDQAKLQSSMQIENAKLQTGLQLEQAKMSSEQQLEQVRNQLESQREAQRLQMEAALEQQKMAMESQIAQRQHESDARFEVYKAQLDAQVKIMVAEISAKSSVDSAQIGAAQEATGEGGADPMKSLMDKLQEMHDELSAPVQYERGGDGKVKSIKKGKRSMNVSYGPDGRMVGVG